MSHTSYHERHAALRALLQREGLDAWLQPVNDEFQSEYVPAYAERLPFLNGFTGSAGLAIVSRETIVQSAMLVDGRYTLQAPQEIPMGEWGVFNSGEVTPAQWAAKYLKEGAKLGCDAWLHTHQQVVRLEKQFTAQGQIFVPQLTNLVDAVWADKPATPVSEVELLPLSHTGRSAAEKIAECVAFLKNKGLAALVLTQPDAVCWLLNLRAAEIPFNPLLLAYALVLRDGRIILLTHPRTWKGEVEKYFASLNVVTHAFKAWFASGALAGQYGLAGASIGIDPSAAAHAWWGWAANAGVGLTDIEDPTLLAKACKHPAEQEGMRQAHRVDGVAVSRFLASLDGAPIRELEVVERLEQMRQSANTYRGPSFATIAGSGPNGAIVHYRATEKTDRLLGEGELLLLDSGGQYLEGTTDITRTVAIGAPSAEMKDRYTRVLKGHIALVCARFPKGTSGRQLDTLARQSLWEVGCDYDHGTGHGVGTYLCVHEGPQRISKKGSDVPLQPGMVLSNEPGYYKTGEYGIRIENLVLVVEEGEGLAFETLTLVPIDTTLIDRTLMSADEIAWLNAYHARVRAEIGPKLLEKHAQVWLGKVCAPL